MSRLGVYVVALRVLPMSISRAKRQAEKPDKALE